MNQPIYTRVKNKLKSLQLNTAAETLDEVIEASVHNKVSYLDFLDHLLGKEIAVRIKTNIQMPTKKADLSTKNTVEEHNPTFRHQLEKKMVMDFFDFTF